jgi:hypothetical protein
MIEVKLGGKEKTLHKKNFGQVFVSLQHDC